MLLRSVPTGIVAVVSALSLQPLMMLLGKRVTSGESVQPGASVPVAPVCTMAPNGQYGAIVQTGATGTDAPGCTDSPLVTRFPKSIISGCSDKADTTATMPVGTERKSIEGEVHETHYNFPPTSSKAQVYRNLKTALQTAGFTLVYDT